MAPPSESDNAPKAPDKPDKLKGDKHGTIDANKEKTLSNLNDCELRDLLDEAITYKNPKDREGKSKLFKELLSQAEESERNARAASAGGSEQVRYCNTSAKRSKHRRKPNSISENVMHGGSLDNLAKEELFEVAHHLNRPKRTVSARQREGGSLPSNVNAGSLASYDPHFLEEARRKREDRGGGSPEPMDVDMETVSLLDHDSVAENFDGGNPRIELIENAAPQGTRHFTTNASLQVNVDDSLHFSDLDPVEKKPYEIEQIPTKVVQTNYSVFIQNYAPLNETGKKVDENGNAVNLNTSSKSKKKKVQADKNVVSCVAAEKVVGHRSDIINDVDELVRFIGENKPQGGAQNRTNAHRSNKQLHKQHTSEEGAKGGKKQRAQSSKGKENRSDLKKSNSMGEISSTNLDSFEFENNADNNQEADSQVAARADDDSASDNPKEKSLCNVEVTQVGNETRNPRTDNLEVTPLSDFRMVTKKKKTKKRRNSVSDNRRKTVHVASSGANSSKSDGDRASSPVPRRKSACSAPHSEKSNDSSDGDSVLSLPIDGSQRMDSRSNQDDAPISYASIAKNSERKMHDFPKKTSPESKTTAAVTSPPCAANDPTSPESTRTRPASVTIPEPPVEVPKVAVAAKAPPPDFQNIKSFPAIQPTNNKAERPSKADKTTGRGGNAKSQQGRQQSMVQNNNAANVDRNTRNQRDANAAQAAVSEPIDIQTNLTMIQANEMGAIQYNSQIMPNMHIPEVQTIEKIHFMNQPGAHMPAHLQQHVVPPHHLHMTLTHPHHHHPVPLMPISDMYTSSRPPGAYAAIISHNPHQPGVAYVKAAQAYDGMGVAYVDPAYLPQKGAANDPNAQHVVVPNVVDGQNVRTATPNETRRRNLSTSETVDNENSDSGNSKLNKSKYNKRLQPSSSSSGSSAELPASSTFQNPSSSTQSSTNNNPTVIASDAATVARRRQPHYILHAYTGPTLPNNSESRTNTNESAAIADSPAVIMRVASNPVVPGLEFGFDLNDELLSGEVTQNFEQRFRAPPPPTQGSLGNQSAMIEYLNSTWEDATNDPDVQYYTE